MEKKNCHLFMFDIFKPDQLPYEEDSLKPCSAQKESATTNSQTISTDKSRKRIKEPKKIPRPPNSFILYRREKQNDILAKNEKISLSEVSKIIGQMWRNEDEREKLRWEVLADKEKLKHAQYYPDYVYRPKRSTKRKSNDKPDESISGPIDRSTTTHGILHDHWSSSSTNHMTSHYAPTPDVYNNIPISQCFNHIRAETYSSPNDYSFNNFDTSHYATNEELFYYNPTTLSSSISANPTNGELFYYNPTTSSSSTMLEDLETYFDESVSPFSAIVEGHYEY